jgi:hypothetical protein
MMDIPLKRIVAISLGVAFLILIASRLFNWVSRYAINGPFSSLIPTLRMFTADTLILIGGGLTIALAFLWSLFTDDGF